MNHNQPQSNKVIIVGGGLAGLTAAAFLARFGLPVTLFERSQHLGGRAITQVKEGFYFNLGPHALYRGGAAVKILRELGLTFQGGAPALGGYAIKDDRKYSLPANPLALMTTRLLSFPAKFEVARLMAAIRQIDPETIQNLSVQHWLEQTAHHVETRQLLKALFRLTTYANDPDHQSAGAGVAQLQAALAANVLYLDSGWQMLVDGLRQAAEGAGVEIVTGAKAATIVRGAGGGVQGVRLANDAFYPAEWVIVAASPEIARSLVERSEETLLSRWAAAARPARVACLTVALRQLPKPKALFALGIDQPLYLSVHSAVARLTPPGEALIHTAKYLPPESQSGSQIDRQELETLLDLVQPGWRQVLTTYRFLPEMVAAHTTTPAAQDGLSGRPGPAVPDIPNLYIAGDWVGPEGMLGDASLASAKQAAHMILAKRRRRLLTRESGLPVFVG